MFGLKRGNPKQEKHLLVTVARHEVSIAVLLVTKRPRLGAVVLWQASAKVSEHELTEEQQRISRYGRALKDLLKKLPNTERKYIDTVAVVLHHPWAGSFWKRVTENFQRPVVFTKRIRERLHQAAQKEFEQIQIKDNNPHAQTLVRLQPIYVELNGYVFQKPDNKRAEEVAIMFQYDLAQQVMMDAVHTALRHEVPHRQVSFFAYQSLLELGAEKLLPLRKSETALFVLVDTLHTNLVLRDRRGHTQQKTIQIGFEALVEFIMRRFKKSHTQAEHLLSLYLEGQVEHSLKEKLERQQSEFLDSWMRQTKQAVSSLLRDTGQPNQVLYTVSDECRQIIQPEQIERAILDATPHVSEPTFFDLRDNVLFQEERGIIAKQEAHLYISALL